MKFKLEDYKLFSKKDVLKFVKQNINGSFSWKGYTLTNKPSHKFGYNKFDYFMQLPIIGLVGLVCGATVVIPFVYIGIFIQQIKG